MDPSCIRRRQEAGVARQAVSDQGSAQEGDGSQLSFVQAVLIPMLSA
jgi:hypothetical protein